MEGKFISSLYARLSFARAYLAGHVLIDTCTRVETERELDKRAGSPAEMTIDAGERER